MNDNRNRTEKNNSTFVNKYARIRPSFSIKPHARAIVRFTILSDKIRDRKIRVCVAAEP